MIDVPEGTPAVTSSVRTLSRYWEESALHHRFEPVQLYSPKETPTRHLTMTEKATVSVVAPLPEDVPEGFSILHEAALRLALFQQRGLLWTMSGNSVATALQRVFWLHPFRYPHRGWELLRALDAADLVEVWLSPELSNGADCGNRKVRMHERIAELSRAERGQGLPQ